MSERIPVLCENCGRELLIRAENLGRIGKCNYCGYLFRAQLHSRFELGVSPPSSSSDRGSAGGAPASRSPRYRERHQALSRHLGPEPPPDPAAPFAPHETPLALEQAREETRPARDTFLGELPVLREAEETRALAALPDAASTRENAEQFDALRAECNRFREETEVLRARMEAQAAETASRSEQLARDCAAACAERDRLRRECEQWAREADRVRDLSDAEREALIKQVDNLQNRLEELERAQDKSAAEHRAASAAWDERRQQLEACADRQRQELDEAGRRCTEQEARFAADVQVWRQQSDEQQRRLDEVTQRLRAAEQLQAQTAHDRDARADEVKQLQARLAAAEQSRATAESEHDQARAGWERERRELEAAAERQCQQLRSDADRRLAKQEARFASERKAWDQQCREHEQLATMWESLAHEVEQVQASLIDDRDALTREVEVLRQQYEQSEQSRTAAEAQLHEARGAWNRERQELEQQVREQQHRLDELAEQLRSQLASADGFRERLDTTRRERDVALQQVAAIGRERDRLQGILREAEAARRQAERSGQAERDRIVVALDQARRETAAAVERDVRRAEEVNMLRAELERQRRENADRDEEGMRCVAALRRRWEAERQRWVALLAAARPEATPGGPAPMSSSADAVDRPAVARRWSRRDTGAGEAIAVDAQLPSARGAATPLRARPQACSYREPETFRAHLEQWLAEAQDRLEERTEDRLEAQNSASARWLEYEIRTAREEIMLLDSSQASQPGAGLEQPAAPGQEAQEATLADPER
jgi:hypothetical protein